MLSQGRVSIIIPVYNVVKYLDKCIDSITKQTYEDLEILLIDDGSMDGSGLICDEWAKRDKRIRVYHQINKGVSNARNVGLQMCTGNFVAFVDADDWCEPQMYQALVSCLKENHADVAMCGFVDYPHGIEHPIIKGGKPVASCGKERAILEMYARNGYFTAMWNKLFRKALLLRNGSWILFHEEYAIGEDELFIAEVMNNCKKAAFVPQALYHWRPREGSAVRQTVITEKMLSRISAKKQVLSLFQQDQAVIRAVRSVMYNECFSMVVLAYCANQKEYFHCIRRELRPLIWDWFRSTEVSPWRKAKILILKTEMGLRLPIKLVKKTDELRHHKKRRGIL